MIHPDWIVWLSLVFWFWVLVLVPGRALILRVRGYVGDVRPAMRFAMAKGIALDSASALVFASAFAFVAAFVGVHDSVP